MAALSHQATTQLSIGILPQIAWMSRSAGDRRIAIFTTMFGACEVMQIAATIAIRKPATANRKLRCILCGSRKGIYCDGAVGSWVVWTLKRKKSEKVWDMTTWSISKAAQVCADCGSQTVTSFERKRTGA
jgi:hypothetical protein